MKTSFIVLTIIFLFGGMLLIALSISHNDDKGTTGIIASNLTPEQSRRYDRRLTIKQIDSITSNLNLPFTSINAKGINPQYVTNHKPTPKNYLSD